MVKISRFERYLTKEIGIEFKACTYFFGMLFYYCMYKICNGIYVADILHMTELIIMTYVMGYLQTFLLSNFDEADSITLKGVLYTVLCSSLYSGLAALCNWYDGSIPVVIGFGAYTALLYLCMYLVCKLRRRIDDKILNNDLENFKNKL